MYPIYSLMPDVEIELSLDGDTVIATVYATAEGVDEAKMIRVLLARGEGFSSDGALDDLEKTWNWMLGDIIHGP